MTIREDMIQRIKEYRSERTVTGRALAVLVEQTMAKMTDEQLDRDFPDNNGGSMSIGETLARINRIERLLGIKEVKVNPQDIKAYRSETGSSLSYAHDVVLKHEIAKLFQEESK